MFDEVNRTDATASISGNQIYSRTAMASEPAAKTAASARAAPDASSDAAITPDTVTAGSEASPFMADASASDAESLAGDPAPPAASDMAGDVLASYADAASAAGNWTEGPAQDGAAGRAGAHRS